MKKIMYILTFLLCFTFMENINAEIYSCFSDGTDTCIKRVYKYGKEGDIKDYEITLGVFHLKRGGSSNNAETLKASTPRCEDIDKKYCENIFRISGDGSDKVLINVSSDTEVFPIAICAQPGVAVNDSNAHKYIYFTEEDINNNKSNCSEKDIFYSEEAHKKTNKVCKVITNIKALNNVNYINNYSISGKVIGGGICELTIKYQEVKNGPEIVTTTTVGTEHCYNSSGYKLLHNKTGDPLHPTHSWDIQYCQDEVPSSKVKVGFTCDLVNEKDSSDTIQIAFVHNDAVEEKYKSKKYNYIHNIAINKKLVKKIDPRGFKDENCPSYIYYMYNTAYIDSDGSFENILKEEHPGDRYKTYKLVNINSKKDLYKDEIKETGVPKEWIYEGGSSTDIEDNDDINDKTDTVGFLDLKDKEVMCNGYTIPYGLPYIIHKIINFIKIIVPIILIILGLIDYSKAVMSGSEDEMKKNTARFIKRTISAIIVFFVIAIVQFAFNILGNNDTFSCFSCFVSGDDCNIVTKE